MSRISDECPDCGATSVNVMGFACSHKRCPFFAGEHEPCPVCGNEERGQGGYLSCECPAPVRQHEWFTYGRLNWECCRVCGIVLRQDGKNSPCKGPAPVGLRENSAPAA